MAICIKVNCSGSWANLIPCAHVSRLESAKAACEALALATFGDIAFRIIQDGEVIGAFSKKPRNGEPHGWYVPKSIISNPVQAGIDRTTSGAIGQP